MSDEAGIEHDAETPVNAGPRAYDVTLLVNAIVWAALIGALCFLFVRYEYERKQLLRVASQACVKRVDIHRYGDLCHPNVDGLDCDETGHSTLISWHVAVDYECAHLGPGIIDEAWSVRAKSFPAHDVKACRPYTNCEVNA